MFKVCELVILGWGSQLKDAEEANSFEILEIQGKNQAFTLPLLGELYFMLTKYERRESSLYRSILANK